MNKNLIIECLQELSDPEMQRRLWLSTKDEVSSFTEAVEQLFTDSGLEDQLHAHETGLGVAAEDALLKLETQLSQIDQNVSPSDLIDSAAMGKVRALASTALHFIEAEKSRRGQADDC